MKILKTMLFLFIIYTFTSFAETTDWAAVKKSIIEMNNKMADALIKNDHAYMMSLYADDPISLPSYSPMLKGKAAIEEMGKKDMEKGTKYISFSMTNTDFFGSGDIAVDIGTYTINLSTNTMPDIKDNGKYMTIWQKQSDGSWKVKAETWNTDHNPWEEMMKHKSEMKMDHKDMKMHEDKK